MSYVWRRVGSVDDDAMAKVASVIQCLLVMEGVCVCAGACVCVCVHGKM